MKRSPLAWLVVALLAFTGACGNDMFDPDDPRLDGARLEIVGSSAVTLMYGASADLRVRYVAADGAPIENAPLDYEIVGEGGGSRLAAFQTVTDMAGGAGMSLTAGSGDANFQVTVIAPNDAMVTFDVAVTGTESGSIVVTMTYAGERSFDRFDVLLYEGESCSGIDPAAAPTALRSQTASNLSAMPGFAGIPVGSNYTVAVVARTGSAVSAFGCRDGIGVTNGNQTDVTITLMDEEIAPVFVGTWDLDNRFDFGGALPETVETVLDALTEIADDNDTNGDEPTPYYEQLPEADSDGDGRGEYGQDPGAFFVDVAMRQTCKWECDTSDTYDSCEPTRDGFGDMRLFYQHRGDWFGSPGSTPAKSRFAGGCFGWTVVSEQAQTLVNDQFDRLPDFVSDWLDLISDLASAITNARILSELRINMATAGNEFDLPMQHELREMVVTFRNPASDPPGAMEERRFLLSDAGLEALMVDEITTVDGTTLTIPEHSFTLNWGELVLYIYRNVLLREIWGVTSTGALLAEWVDCDQIADWLDDAIDSVPGGSSVSRDTLLGVCTSALTAAGGFLEAQLQELLDVDGTLTIGGSAVGMDIDESTGRVDTLGNGMWSGCFTDDTSTDCTAFDANPITGTFTGTRQTDGG